MENCITDFSPTAELQCPAENGQGCGTAQRLTASVSLGTAARPRVPPSRTSYMPAAALDGDTDGTCHISKSRAPTMTLFVPISVTHTLTWPQAEVPQQLKPVIQSETGVKSWSSRYRPSPERQEQNPVPNICWRGSRLPYKHLIHPASKHPCVLPIQQTRKRVGLEGKLSYRRFGDAHVAPEPSTVLELCLRFSAGIRGSPPTLILLQLFTEPPSPCTQCTDCALFSANLPNNRTASGKCFLVGSTTE